MGHSLDDEYEGYNNQHNTPNIDARIANGAQIATGQSPNSVESFIEELQQIGTIYTSGRETYA